MAKQQKIINKEKAKDEVLLSCIFALDKQIKKTSAILTEAKKERDNLIWRAQQENITRAGNYELVTVPKTIRSIDMAAMWLFPEKELIQKIAKVTLTDAEMVFGKDRLATVILSTTTESYKVREICTKKESD